MTDKRIKLARAAEILGMSERTVRAKAACGMIPGAGFKFKRWTFDETKLRKFVSDMEAEICRSVPRHRMVVFGVAASSGAVSRSRTETSSGLYEQTIQKMRSLVATKNAGF